MQQFSPEFTSKARLYLDSGRGVFIQPENYVPIPSKEVVPNFFSRLSSQYGIDVVKPHEAVRKDQEEVLAKELIAGEPILLQGFWRTGQSSMIKALERRFGRANSIPLSFYVDGEHFNERKIPTDRKVFLGVEEILQLFDSDLKKIADLRARENLMLLVSVQLHPGHDQRIAKAFTGFNTHFLRPLRREEVGILIRSPLVDSPVSVTDEAMDAIAEYCGGWPTAVKTFFQTFLYGWSSFTRWKEVYDADDVKSLTNRSPEELFGSRFGHALSHFARIYHEGIRPNQQNALDKIAAANELPIEKLDYEMIDVLIKTGLVVVTADNQAYKINGVFLRDLITSGFIQKIG
ncbi:hypothetical protein HYW43_01665 [Candidatus Daviesbacteria bacterium]|nr:hypothetical protein [Candidatus Daviesbacteria bacterium]